MKICGLTFITLLLSSYASAKNLTSFAPANNLTSFAPANNLTSFAPANNLTSFASAKNLTSFAPAKNLTSFDPAKNLTSFAPAKNLTSFAPAKRLTSFAPAKRLTSFAPAKNLTSFAQAKNLTSSASAKSCDNEIGISMGYNCTWEVAPRSCGGSSNIQVINGERGVFFASDRLQTVDQLLSGNVISQTCFKSYNMQGKNMTCASGYRNLFCQHVDITIDEDDLSEADKVELVKNVLAGLFSGLQGPVPPPKGNPNTSFVDKMLGMFGLGQKYQGSDSEGLLSQVDLKDFEEAITVNGEGIKFP